MSRRFLIVVFVVALFAVPAVGILYGALGAVVGGLGILAALIAIQLPILIWLKRRGLLTDEEPPA